MIFPEGVSGPAIADGDLVSFRFSESVLTMRLPKIPYNHDSADRVSEVSDWRDQDVRHWDDFFNGKQKELVYQVWKYEDINTHDDIALCMLGMNIQRLNNIDDEYPITLNADAFRDQFLSGLIADEINYGVETREGWPTAANLFFAEPIEKPILDGSKFLLDLHIKRAPHPMPLALFVLGEALCLSITFTLRSLHYSDSENPFDNETLHQLKMDLFNELLAHIQIDYSPDLVEKIEAMK